ncbi:LacI family DNA-binding transcriptional regulator [Microbacterium sp. ZW T5_56]|uniref:LacI family DNA-binding transcriptional regulator n=1 Tax=Microbacterium sp. ZW T5_56 TaxID=3378081 RepID=UPI0038538D05
MSEIPMAPDLSSPPVAAATLHDVAQAAGVSLATASRVLNGSTRRVAEAYRERVQAAADQLGYTANLSAQATARGTSAIVALLVADIADPYFGQIAAGVARGADEAGLVVTIAITERDPAREVRVIRALRGQRPRGLILAASRNLDHDAAGLSGELAALSASGTRAVALGRGDGDVRWLAVDNHAGAYELASRMSALGYRRAIVLAAAEGLRTSDDRVAGFAAGFTEGGGEAPRVLRGSFSRQGGIDLMTQALEDGIEAGTLVFGISDVVAIGAMRAIRDAGRSVGADIAVCGFDDIPTSSDVTPALTTVRVPLDEIGYQALHAAVTEDWSGPGDAVELTVVARDSTPARS